MSDLYIQTISLQVKPTICYSENDSINILNLKLGIMENNTQTCKMCNSPSVTIDTNYSLVECTECGLIFCNKVYSQSEIIQTYNNLYNDSNTYQKHIKESDILKAGQMPKLGRNKLKILHFLFKNNCQSFLEIGAGVGIVGKYLLSKGFQYSGIELDKKTAERACSIELDVKNGSFEIMESTDEQYDAIIGFEVLEHLQELKRFLSLSLKKIKNSGYLAFTVPNYEKIYNYKDTSKLHQDAPPIHLNFFTQKNIKKILNQNSYEVVFLEVRRFPYLNWKQKATYKFLLWSLFHKFNGPTILCVAQKKP